MIKRLIDITVAFLGLVLFSPLFLIIALLIRVTMGPPVFFIQVRPGYKEKPFTIIKFRTMRQECYEDGKPLSDSQRLTALGKFLRKTSMDELPQLWNVLKGEMSLVGPRPLLIEYLPYYTKRERKRHSVRPGITGLAQVNGRNLLEWDDRLELDVQYVKNQSITLDLQIIFKTLKKVIKRSDVLTSTENTEGSLITQREIGVK